MEQNNNKPIINFDPNSLVYTSQPSIFASPTTNVQTDNELKTLIQQRDALKLQNEKLQIQAEINDLNNKSIANQTKITTTPPTIDINSQTPPTTPPPTTPPTTPPIVDPKTSDKKATLDNLVANINAGNNSNISEQSQAQSEYESARKSFGKEYKKLYEEEELTSIIEHGGNYSLDKVLSDIRKVKHKTGYTPRTGDFGSIDYDYGSPSKKQREIAELRKKSQEYIRNEYLKSKQK